MVYLFISLTILFNVVGQLLVKHGMLRVGKSPFEAGNLPRFLLSTFTHPSFVAGLFCAFLAAGTWAVAISRSDLSFSYPFMGLTIVFTLVFSGLVFGEHVPPLRWVGVLIVCVGIIVAAKAK
jgi:drug/metabolite transporter (DMT)-like permease